VFSPIQSEITARVNDLSHTELERTKLASLEEYLQASNRKDLFRDIVIEAEYDPFRKADSIRYNGTVTDPCKATSLASPEHLDTGLLTARRAPQPGPRDTFSPEMWAKAEATPYGRYSHQNPRTYQRRTCPTHGEEAPNPVPDHYTVLSHKALKEVSKKENGLGKSVTGPMPSTVIQHGSGKKPVTGPPSQLHSL
jgi:hypothetical protein